MKKLFALLAVALGVVACQKDQADFGVNVGGEQEVTINVALSAETRANSALGSLDNDVLASHDLRYILEIYQGDHCLRMEKFSKEDNVAFPVRLAPGREYNFVVWADFVEEGTKVDLYYNTHTKDENGKDLGLKNIIIIDGAPMNEARDAFYGNAVLGKNDKLASLSTIELTRPFAKVRVVTTDVQDLVKIGVALPTEATVAYQTDINNKFNAFTGEASSDANADKTYTFNYANTYDVENGEMTLFADYLFVNANATTKFNLDIKDFESKPFTTEIPVVANQITTIKGDILTNGGDINVDINDKFNGETIYLEGNVTLTENLNVNRPLVVAAGKTAVLNLNGYNIINTNPSENYGEGEGIVVYGNLTIEGEGTIQGTSMAVWARGNDNAVINIKGGTFVGCQEGLAKGGRSVVYASSGNTINIYGGNVQALAADKTSYANKTEGVYAALNVADNNGMINVYGGRFYKQNPAAPGTEPAAWNANHPNGFVANGYVSVANGECFDVMKGVAVANINDFNTALSNAENAAINVTNDVNFGTANSISVERDVILNFNDNDVVAGGGTTKNASIDIFGDYTVTVNDANITGGSIMAYYGADVVLNNVKLTYNWYQSGRNMIYAASDNDKQVVTVINGGYYDMTGGSGNRYICAHGNAIVYVNGGTFTGKGPGATYAPFDAINIGSYTARIIISGGTFDFDPSKNYIGSGNTVYAPTATIAEGYKVVDNSNGTWSVVKQ